MQINTSTLKAFQKHVLKCYPQEACGFVVNNKYIPVTNSAEDPLKNFAIDPIHQMAAKSLGVIQAVLHSHPYDKFNTPKWSPQWPTTADMESWMKADIPWGIAATCGEGITELVWLDEKDIQPLEGRDFIHGVNDCYSIIRDWYRTNKQITFPNFARGIEWWYAGKNLYDENFEAVGFVTIPIEQADVGDCVMMKVASEVTNHAAVIVGPNQILHHMFNRLSGVDSLSKWKRCIVRAVRYQGK
jgi:cell wall-associated NlpC family hydrolase